MSETPDIRPYHPTASYHVFNRGAHHNNVFLDKNDYWNFRRITKKVMQKYDQEVSLRCFCLLPNHYHYLLYQQESWQISKFMKSIGIRYARYFNKKYNLSGQVFEAEYQCLYLPTDEDVLRVEKYIMNNPINAGFTNWIHSGWKM